MKFRLNPPVPEPTPEPEKITEDPTGYLIHSGLGEFLLLSTPYIKYMAMLGYTFMHGAKLFPRFENHASTSYKFVSMVLQCTGGGILVPVFLNAIPVPLAQDAYPLAILAAFFLHLYFPILRDVMKLSPILHGAVIFLYETLRASIVVKFTAAAGKAIPATEFSFPLFGPIFCGTVSGCGGAFLPFNKGLDPLKQGIAQPMLSAFVAATFYHLFVSTNLSNGVAEAPQKAQVVIAIFFIAYNVYTSEWSHPDVGSQTTATTIENKKTK